MNKGPSENKLAGPEEVLLESADLEPAEEVEEQPFTLGQWKQFTTYKCTKCPFDTMDESIAHLHFHQAHVMPQAPQMRPTEALLYDGKGNMVDELPVTPGNAASVSPRFR